MTSQTSVDIAISTHNYVLPSREKSGLEQVLKMTFKEMSLRVF